MAENKSSKALGRSGRNKAQGVYKMARMQSRNLYSALIHELQVKLNIDQDILDRKLKELVGTEDVSHQYIKMHDRSPNRMVYRVVNALAHRQVALDVMKAKLATMDTRSKAPKTKRTGIRILAERIGKALSRDDLGLPYTGPKVMVTIRTGDDPTEHWSWSNVNWTRDQLGMSKLEHRLDGRKVVWVDSMDAKLLDLDEYYSAKAKVKRTKNPKIGKGKLAQLVVATAE